MRGAPLYKPEISMMLLLSDKWFNSMCEIGANGVYYSLFFDQGQGEILVRPRTLA
jgi:hypothetical protein